MSKKDKGGGKGKGKGKKGKKAEDAPAQFVEVLTEVDRTFYELTIEDIKKKILRLRSHIQNLAVTNKNVDEELRILKEDKIDEAGELTDRVDGLYENIIQLRSENAMLTESFNNEKIRTEETIGDLESKYKAMHDQLSAEIKRLNGKLNACEEFRLNRDNWMVKFNERADELADKEEAAKEVFRQMEAKSVYERELLKDELLGKLTLAGEEFTGAGSTSASDFNLRLIRENIALQKNIDILVNNNNEMDQRMQQERELYESNRAGIPELEKRNSQLILESQDKLNVIQNLTAQVQQLKQEYIASLTYREQNISIKEFQMCARFRRQKRQMLVRQFGQQLNEMEHEMNLYDYLIEEYNKEREEIEEHLEKVRLTIERAIGLARRCRKSMSTTTPTTPQRSSIDENSEIISSYEQNSLLNLLVELLQVDFDLLDPERRASIATIKPYEKLTRFDQLFKQEAPSMSSLMDLCVAYIDSDAIELKSRDSSRFTIAMPTVIKYESLEYETILPAQRPLGRNYIFDVESGTSLYYSSELEDPERMEAEAEGAAAEGEEEGSSTSSEGAPKAEDNDDGDDGGAGGDKKKAAETPASTATAAAAAAGKAPSEMSGTSRLPPGTIVDVDTDEGEFEEDNSPVEADGFTEDEEYDINLFY